MHILFGSLKNRPAVQIAQPGYPSIQGSEGFQAHFFRLVPSDAV